MAAAESMSPRVSSISTGSVVGGRYRVDGTIGEGGMGVVFEATHLGLESKVALKVIRSDLKEDEEFVLRFVNEARAAALLKGEHIARVYDVGMLGTGEPYLVMERLEGVGLETVLETMGPLEIPEAVRLVLETCEGLAEAHALSLVHRDIKPANLFLSRRPDGRSILKILDFGIAKRLADKRRRSLTDPARSLGSPWYMSPEQMMDPSRVDARTDIWSLGVLLFELLTREHPFDGESIPEVCTKVLSAPTPSIRALRDDVDRRLDAVLRRCLEKDSARRFPSVHALAESLLQFASVSSSSSSLLLASRGARRRRSTRQTFGTLAPLAESFRRRSSPWSGLFATASVFVGAGAVTWAAFAYGADRSVPSPSWSELREVEFPGDPALNPGPDAEPLSVRPIRVGTPPVVAAVPSEGAAERPNVQTGSRSPDVEPPLTPAEIRRRTARYENWLRERGLKRVSDVTTDANNPY